MSINFKTDKKFSVEFDELKDFCAAIDRFPKAPASVSFVSTGSFFRIYAMSDGFSAVWDTPIQLSWYTSFSVEAQKFTALVKNLYDGEIQFSITDKALKVRKGNVKVDFRIADAIPYSKVPEFYEITDLSIVPSLESHAKAGIKTEKFPGITVDSTNIENCKTYKISNHIVKITSIGRVFDSPCKFTINDNFPKILSVFSGKIKTLLLNENSFGIALQSGIVVYSALMGMPTADNVTDMFGLVDSKCLLDVQKYNCYKFEKSDFVSVLDLVSSVLGEEEHSVRWDIVGKGSAPNEIVWKVGGRTFSGSTVEELIKSESSNTANISFCVNKKNLKKLTSLYGDEISMYVNEADSLLVIANDECSDVTLLVKIRI